MVPRIVYMKTGYESLAWPIHKIMTMTLYYFFSREIADLSENGQLKIIVFTPFIFIAIILPYGRAHLIASALLREIRSEGPRLHPSRLASAVIFARE